ncbi:MAG TPA: peptidylprolyl isomerase [Tenuifilaceae bacterium]|nr:peptidylprolyl isomerase [Tenuifilaceae bacterium]HPE17274.1 peptidylprolyl isomerase [Tenuifilaceae bacterium]HPJ44500.1 peptidylprolyl isomerase [Tenuifilaceae bacterium]HPQ33038.1 peptidylprolyl isomerase [Tenuifilaceae bacterium]HRX67730.1 peptidylprolyl isomerase [Tenuifilaceae bacterium]
MTINFKKTKSFILAAFLAAFNFHTASSQEVIDQVVAVVGADMILLSDIEQEVLRMKMQGYLPDGDVKCNVLEEMLIHKLLLHQAMIDSLPSNEMMVEGEMERRLNFFINQVGSEAALEKYFNKSIFQIKDDIRDMIQETQLTQQMRSKLVENVSITPSEVKDFYKTIPQDSLPQVPVQYELRQIVLYPSSSGDAKFQVRERLLEIRERILKGERFAPLAVAYSEDRASATKGGELGFRSREELVKSFADVAFSLKEGQVSQIVESEYGFHIIQMIEKRGDQVNVRHILMKPSFSSEVLMKTSQRLDSIAYKIRSDSISFINAARLFSEDTKTRVGGGIMINAQTGTSLFEKEHLPPTDFFVIKNLNVGEISEPFESRDEHANIIYKIITVTRIIPTHRANLKDDYATIQTIAKSKKEQDVFMEWVAKATKTTYIKIDPSFVKCEFRLDGWVK